MSDTLFPPYPRDMAPSERRAVLVQAARDMAHATIREGGFDPARIDRSVVDAEAASLVRLAWLEQRVEELEAALAHLGQAKTKSGAAR